jgi:hypothetical protein
MAIIARVFMVLVAYVLACVAAAIVLTVGTLTPQWDELAQQGLAQQGIPSAALWAVAGVSAAVIFGIAALPSLFVIAVAEGFAWRSIVLYGALGGVLALALTYGIDFSGYARGPDTLFAHEREVLAASGIAGGLVYWLFAGRNAGAWKRDV